MQLKTAEERSEARSRRVRGLVMATLVVVLIVALVGSVGSNGKSTLGLAFGAKSVAEDGKNCEDVCAHTGAAEHAECVTNCKKAQPGADFCQKCIDDCLESPKSKGAPKSVCKYNCIEEGICNSAKLKGAIGDIVGGTPTNPNTYPYIVSIQQRGTNNHNCGGSLISARSVLTAAHCVDGRGWDVPRNLEVVLGETRLHQGGESEQVINVEAIVRHPSYRVGSSQFDVAVLTLSDNAKVSQSNIGYANLPPQGQAMPAVGTAVTAIGWGKVGFGVGGATNQLMKADMQVASDWNCRRRTNIAGGWNDHMICAESPGNTQDTCQGDSGGPLIRNSDGVQVGITSWGVRCGALNHPSGFMEISFFRNWIDSKKTGPKKGGCVSTQSLVKVMNMENGEITQKKVRDVSIGDYVQTRNGYEMVWLIAPFGADAVAVREMVDMKVAHDDKIESVVLTKEHLIFDGNTGALRRTDALVIGDKVRMYLDGKECVGTVVEFSTAMAVGISLVTNSGEFVLANGVSVSSYSHSAMYSRVVHALSLPFRWMSRFVTPALGKAALEMLRIPNAVQPGSTFSSLLM